MLNYPPESSYDELLQHMIDDNIIEQSGSGFNIANMGAYTFAKNLSNFEKLKSHAIELSATTEIISSMPKKISPQEKVLLSVLRDYLIILE